jgi:hypothetical protein
VVSQNALALAIMVDCSVEGTASARGNGLFGQLQESTLGTKFIEVTRANVASGGASAGKQIVGAAHIVTVGAGAHRTSVITLVNHNQINVTEAYDDLKRMLGL